MATPPNRNTANTNAQTAKDAITLAADNQFISDAGDAILAAIAQGKFMVTLHTAKGVDVPTVHDYLTNLGYQVAYPGLGMKAGPQPFQPSGVFQPADLFGQLWIDFWNGNVPRLDNPLRMTISWR